MAYIKESTLAFLKSLQKGLAPTQINNNKTNVKSTNPKVMTFRIKKNRGGKK